MKVSLGALLGLNCMLVTSAASAATRPNILFLFADNWQYEHAGANGCAAVKTPLFDRIAREGVRFTNAYCPVPSCGPARSSLVTGRAAHELEDLANHGGIFHGKFRVYADALQVAGYHVGYSGKGWAPGIYLGHGRTVHPTGGKQYRDFAEFLAARSSEEQPFFFWLGSQHTAKLYWMLGAGKRRGVDPAAVRVPAYLPDVPVVREEIANYLAQVEAMDAAFSEAVALLEKRGGLENTVVVYGSDNGWQMPRGLANVYDAGCRVPLAIRWPGSVTPGRVIDDFVSLTDFAPTFLEMAGLVPWPEMTGRSFVDVLTGRHSAVARDHVFLERERHSNARRGDLSYPIRAVRTRDHLYIRNLRPERWPAGDPIAYLSVGHFGDVDETATKNHVIENRRAPSVQPLFALAFRKRPAEELYDLRQDPDQIHNVASRPENAAVIRDLAARIDRWMKETGDPRLDPAYERFNTYPYFGGGLAPVERLMEAMVETN